MARWRQAVELAMNDGDVARLLTISRSRAEPASWVERAQMLLAYREKPSFFAVGQRLGVHHQTVQRCIERALAYGPLMALDAALHRLMMHAQPLSYRKKRWLLAISQKHLRTLHPARRFGSRARHGQQPRNVAVIHRQLNRLPPSCHNTTPRSVSN